jgi:hypothetical protein
MSSAVTSSRKPNSMRTKKKKARTLNSSCPYCGSRLNQANYIEMMDAIRRKYMDILAEQVSFRQDIEKLMEQNSDLEKVVIINNNKINHMLQLDKALNFELGKLLKISDSRLPKTGPLKKKR